MDADYRMLGQRIVEAARLAVAVHLHSSLSGVPSYRQRVVIGGAGPAVVESAPADQRPSDPQDALRHGDDPFTDEQPLPAAPDRNAPRSAPYSADGGAA